MRIYAVIFTLVALAVVVFLVVKLGLALGAVHGWMTGITAWIRASGQQQGFVTEPIGYQEYVMS
jgi:hypothetical protein